MSSSTPEITVAMPAYNAASHLLEAIESILAQSFEDFELLVVDDGSTDNTLALAKSFDDKRIRVELLPSNKGRATARNMASGRARGRYLAWMDADDIAMPHRLEAQHACLEAQSQIHICGAGVQYFEQSSALELFPEQPGATRAATLFGVPVPNCCVMVRLDAMRAFGLRYDASLARAEDMAFWADALLKAGLQAVNLQEPLLHYRYAPAAHARQWHMRALLGHVFPPLGIRATGAQAALHAGLIYGGPAEPEAALRWLDILWQAWTDRYGYDEYMQRHMLVFMARILREASADAAQADRAGRLLRTLSLAALAENI